MYAKIRNHALTVGFIVLCLFSYTSLAPLSIITRGFGSANSVAMAIADVKMNSVDIVERASHVLVGEVESKESHWDKATGSVYTFVKVHVEERLKGTIQDDYIVIKHKGGEIGAIGLLVSSEPRFFLGEKVKVFLKQEEGGEFTVLDGWKGKVSLSASASLGYQYSGFHWDLNDLPVPYYINENGTSDVLGTNEELQAVQASFQTWEDDPDSIMDYTYMGTTTRSNESLDGYNVVSWKSIDGPSKTLANTAFWYNNLTLHLIEFDIVFDEDETWSATGESNKHDIQNVGTHEVGHTLVLDDLIDAEDSEQTMYGYSSLGETKKKTLEAGDLAGIRHIYPTPTPVYTITTSPSGLLMEIDGANYTSPKSFEWASDSTHTIYVPSTQNGTVNTTRYVFTGWSDGGAQRHQITVGTSSVTITASYLTQHFVTIRTQGLDAAYPANINFTQANNFKKASTSGSWSDWCDFGSTLTINSLMGGEEGERWVTYDATSWTVSSALTATLSYVLQYQVSMVFKTYDQELTLQPTQVKILGGSPNNTLVTLASYSEVWLNNVTWSLKKVLWRNTDVTALDAPSVNLAPSYVWTIICRVYPISFDSSFRNFNGAELSESPSSFRLQFPNGTLSRQLDSSKVYYIQNGTTQWKSIMWQDVDVAPIDAYFDATDGNPVVNCLIYDFEIKVSDSLGFPVAGALVAVELSNGRTVNTQTGSDGVAVIRMAPQGSFTASVSYLGQIVTVSGKVDKAASATAGAKMTFGLSFLILLSVIGVLAGVLVVFLILRTMRSSRRVVSV